MLARLLTSTPTTSSLIRSITFTSRTMSLSPCSSLKTSFADLAAKLELANPDLLRSTNYVDGQWVASSRPESEATFAVRDPATDKVIGHAPDLTAEEVRLVCSSLHSTWFVELGGVRLRLTSAVHIRVVPTRRSGSPSTLPRGPGRAGPTLQRRYVGQTSLKLERCCRGPPPPPGSVHALTFSLSPALVWPCSLGLIC